MSVIQVLIRRSSAVAAVACFLCSSAFAAPPGRRRLARLRGPSGAADRLGRPRWGQASARRIRPPPYLWGLHLSEDQDVQGIRHSSRSCTGDARALQGGAKGARGVAGDGPIRSVRRRESGFLGAGAGGGGKSARASPIAHRSRDLLAADARSARAGGRRAARRSASRWEWPVAWLDGPSHGGDAPPPRITRGDWGARAIRRELKPCASGAEVSRAVRFPP